MNAVVGLKEKLSANIRQRHRVGTAAAWHDFLDNHGAGRRSVAPPELPSARQLFGGEKHRSIQIGKTAHVDIGVAVVKVEDEAGARGGAVRLPHIDIGYPRIGAKKKPPVNG